MNPRIAVILGTNRLVIPALVGAGLISLSGVGGYYLGKRRGVDQFLDKVNESYQDQVKENSNQMTFDQYEAEKAREDAMEQHPANGEPEAVRIIDSFFDMRVDSISLVPDPIEELGTSITVVDDDDAIEVAPNPHILEPITTNVFDNDDDWDYAVELPAREGQEKYVIHVDEFMPNEYDYRQGTLTYYRGDDILADELDVPMYNYNELLGELKFGHGSGQANVVYIRNDKEKMEWEVLLHTGHFSVEVRGLQIEQAYEADDIKHSGMRRFRDTD